MNGKLILAALVFMLPADASAQSLLKRLKRSATEAAARSTEQAVSKAVSCALGDTACADKAKAEGKKVVIDSSAAAPAPAPAPASTVAAADTVKAPIGPEPLVPGKGAWA